MENGNELCEIAAITATTKLMVTILILIETEPFMQQATHTPSVYA